MARNGILTFMFTDPETLPPPKRDPALPATLAYILYLAGMILAGFPWIAAIILAYVFRDSAPEWIATHYRFQIRTFWISIVLCLIAAPLCLVLVGFALFGLIWLWAVIRLAKGLLYMLRQEPHPDPATWGIG